jgi:integrase
METGVSRNKQRLHKSSRSPSGARHTPFPRGARDDCPYFFWSGDGTVRSLIRTVTETMTAVYKASGVLGASSHRFRHTLATEILEMGGTTGEAADVLGDFRGYRAQALR